MAVALARCSLLVRPWVPPPGNGAGRSAALGRAHTPSPSLCVWWWPVSGVALGGSEACRATWCVACGFPSCARVRWQVFVSCAAVYDLWAQAAAVAALVSRTTLR
jgi:hypothetical protein